jgi:hypothetical protein
MQKSGTYRRLYDLQFDTAVIEQGETSEPEFDESEALEGTT